MMRFWITLTLAASLLGCGGGTAEKSLPKTAPVSGIVTLDSKPLEGAVVRFYPTGATQGIECMGVTDAAGKYKLQQIRGGEGAPPGDYKVVISRFLKKDGTLPAPDEPPANVDASESLPKRYSDLEATTLTANVPAAGGEFPFQVTAR